MHHKFIIIWITETVGAVTTLIVTVGIITKAIIDVAHALDMRVIAEGVEKVEHVELLQELGCDSIQGFYLSEALPRAEVTKLLHIGIPGKTRSRTVVAKEEDELALA